MGKLINPEMNTSRRDYLKFYNYSGINLANIQSAAENSQIV